LAGDSRRQAEQGADRWGRRGVEGHHPPLPPPSTSYRGCWWGSGHLEGRVGGVGEDSSGETGAGTVRQVQEVGLNADLPKF